jgi:tRNA A58 N-methylase Trm61
MRHWTVVVTPEDLEAIAARAGVQAEDGALELGDPSGNVIRLETA